MNDPLHIIDRKDVLYGVRRINIHSPLNGAGVHMHVTYNLDYGVRVGGVTA